MLIQRVNDQAYVRPSRWRLYFLPGCEALVQLFVQRNDFDRVMTPPPLLAYMFPSVPKPPIYAGLRLPCPPSPIPCRLNCVSPGPLELPPRMCRVLRAGPHDRLMGSGAVTILLYPRKGLQIHASTVR